MEKIISYYYFSVLLFLVLLQGNVLGYQYKVGDLNAWGIPPSSNSRVYSMWPDYHPLRIGDSLLFLYPPSQDSVVQVTAEAFTSCNATNPILNMKDGNSLFNVTSNGTFYFISGASGHCEKNQKLRVSIGSRSESAVGSGAVPGDDTSSSSYPTVFGSIPVANSTASSSSSSIFPGGLIAFAAIVSATAFLYEMWGPNLY